MLVNVLPVPQRWQTLLHFNFQYSITSNIDELLILRTLCLDLEAYFGYINNEA